MASDGSGKSLRRLVDSAQEDLVRVLKCGKVEKAQTDEWVEELRTKS